MIRHPEPDGYDANDRALRGCVIFVYLLAGGATLMAWAVGLVH